MISTVYLVYKNGVKYQEENFNPGECYPEYRFGKDNINKDGNIPYDMLRTLLYDMNLDREHYGTKDWNPLGKYIKPGNFVIVKPNLEMHINENKTVQENAFECLITHASLIRAVCDYCLIALNGTGKLMIGDAPMQGCNFDTLLEKSKLFLITEFYSQFGLDVTIKDFRQYQSVFNRNKVIINKKYNAVKPIRIHMGKKSQHMNSNSNGIYQVSDYDIQDTARYHHRSIHDYDVIEDIIKADVIINFCKPKTHRLAGFTAAMKNMVGIIYNKACLPHRSAGSIEEQGDAYLHKSYLKKVSDRALTKKIRAENCRKYLLATFYRYVYGISLVISRKFGKDPYYIGSWYGNDTIWRTVCDLNYIVKYSDKNGNLCDEPQRVILNLGDMIIAGEGNGPVSPEPKKLGALSASEDQVAFDMVICKLMGFSVDKIPLVKSIINGEAIFKKPSVILYRHNLAKEVIIKKDLENVCFGEKWRFKPHEAWKEQLKNVN